MKLKLFNQQTTPKIIGAGNTTPKVSVTKNGVFNLNGAACQLMELKAGDKITLAQDEDEKDNWYFFKDAVNGFQIRSAYDKNMKGCMFNHKLLSSSFIKTIGLKESLTHQFLIAGQPTIIKNDKTKYWGILITKKVS